MKLAIDTQEKYLTFKTDNSLRNQLTQYVDSEKTEGIESVKCNDKGVSLPPIVLSVDVVDGIRIRIQSAVQQELCGFPCFVHTYKSEGTVYEYSNATTIEIHWDVPVFLGRVEFVKWL